MPDRSSARAYRALVDRIKTIQGSGSGHFTNLANRVYTRHWLPEAAKSDLPYVCIPMLATAAAPDTDEGNLIRDVWRANIIGYTPETLTSMQETSAIEAALNLKDDIFDVMMQDWKLGGQIENSTIVSWDITGGEPADAKYARLIISVQLRQYLSDEVFGP